MVRLILLKSFTPPVCEKCSPSLWRMLPQSMAHAPKFMDNATPAHGACSPSMVHAPPVHEDCSPSSPRLLPPVYEQSSPNPSCGAPADHHSICLLSLSPSHVFGLLPQSMSVEKCFPGDCPPGEMAAPPVSEECSPIGACSPSPWSMLPVHEVCFPSS